ncbi:hypothetical protein F4680DRAFT_464065 [Xylaria scruposa]|nr:hypothetical protein F4680DRAFT_464065 [Xylaria scruposa]
MAHVTPADRRGDLGFYEHSMAKKGTKIQIFVQTVEIDTGMRLDKSKTIGTITTKNSSSILMAAHSGYSAGSNREDSCLDTKKWNHLALRHVAKQIGFQFPKNIRDNSRNPILEEHCGRAHAGHVEVLLASWFVVHLLRRELDSADKSDEKLITQLRRLKEIDLGDSRTSFIVIDSEPCRTCLQFINKLSQYTGILFMVSGSRGIGPVRVRVDGQRRLDVVEDYFSDSEDETPSREVNTQVGEAVEKTPFEDTATPDVSTPVAPARLTLRRPQSSFERPPQWIPENPDEMVSSYRKKTPVYEWPGYEGGPRRNPVTPSKIEGHWKIPPPSSRVQSTEASEGVADEAIEHEWEDLGDGLMICSKNATNDNQVEDAVKSEQGSNPSPSSIDDSRGDTPLASGNIFARAAYEAINEIEYEVVERPRNTEAYFRNHPPRRTYREPASSTRVARRLAPVGPRLQRFRHQAIHDSDESIFKSRYSILNPRFRR